MIRQKKQWEEFPKQMPAAVMRLNKAKTKLPFFRKLLYNVNYLI